MAPDTGPNEGVSQNDEYLNGVPPYNFPDPSSDEDDEDGDYDENYDDSDSGNMGYQLLNQEVEDGDGSSCNQQDNGNHEDGVIQNNTCDSTSMVPLFSLMLPAPKEETPQELDSVSRSDIDLDENKIDQIKKAMSGFQLPSSSFPGWASAVSEDELADFVHFKAKSS